VPNQIREFAWGELSYSAPVGPGLRLRGSIGGSTSKGKPEGFATLIGGDSWEATLGLQKLWAIGRRLRVWAGLTADERHIEHHWTPTYGYTDEVFALRGRLEATHAAPGQASNVFAQLSAGERRDARGDGSRFLSRTDAEKQFWKINAHASHYRDLGAHAGIYAAVDGQWTPDRLMTSEGFALGGAPYGRGYDYATLLGDRGVAGTVELRAGFAPKGKLITFVQGYTFVDAGKAWGSGPLDRSASIASAGLGVRLRLAKQATLGIEAARRLNRTAADPKPGWRPSIYLSAEF
jgi:hemolysin activation/secretion protein